MINIVHVITGLGRGGAEGMLYKLLKYSDRDRFNHEVILLTNEGSYGKEIQRMGYEVHCLEISIKNMFSSLVKARNICKKADLINTWLYHADLIGFIVAKLLLRKKLIWNIRHSNLDKNVIKPTTLKIVKLNAFLSKYVDCITFNSYDALDNHLQMGYSNKNTKIFPNGFEVDIFKFNINAREKIRQEYGLGENKVLITVGRWNIFKDYYTLLRALSELKKHNDKFKMLMVGADLTNSNSELTALIDRLDLKDNIILLGRRIDIPELLSAADIYISSSLGESFSNAIGEAMACELPCVVTDVGDSKLIVGDTGKVVPAKDFISLSKVLIGYLENSDFSRNIAARNRIIDKYEIKKVTRMFEDNYANFFQNVT